MRRISRITPIRPPHPSNRSGISICNAEGWGDAAGGEEAVADGANCAGVVLGAGVSVEVAVTVGVAVGIRVYVGATGPLSREAALSADRVW